MENKEHTNCGTPNCCMSCESAEPVQLELWPVSIYEKDTKQKPLSFDGGVKSTLSYNRKGVNEIN